MSEDDLTKIHVDLPNNEDVGGESLWAEELGNNLYRLRNVPFNAYGLNFHDVVYAKSESDELKPSILKVHQYSAVVSSCLNCLLQTIYHWRFHDMPYIV